MQRSTRAIDLLYGLSHSIFLLCCVGKVAFNMFVVSGKKLPRDALRCRVVVRSAFTATTGGKNKVHRLSPFSRSEMPANRLFSTNLR